MEAFQIVAGWWRHQPGRSAVGGVSTAHMKHGKETIGNAPEKKAFLNYDENQKTLVLFY